MRSVAWLRHGPLHLSPGWRLQPAQPIFPSPGIGASYYFYHVHLLHCLDSSTPCNIVASYISVDSAQVSLACRLGPETSAV